MQISQPYKPESLAISLSPDLNLVLRALFSISWDPESEYEYESPPIRWELATGC